MTQQTEDRTAALRALLVDLPSQTSPSRQPSRRRSRILATAAVGAVAFGAILSTVQLTSPQSRPEANPPVASDPRAGSSTGSASRVRLYASVDELIADSGAVVLGTVQDQRPGPDGTTVSTLAVERSFEPARLGQTSPEPPVEVAAGSAVRVRTFGGMVSALPTAPLTPGTRYLLFLSPTGLPSAGEDEFFVTGVVAGIYEAQGDRYVRVADDGDTLPAELREDDLG